MGRAGGWSCCADRPAADRNAAGDRADGRSDEARARAFPSPPSAGEPSGAPSIAAVLDGDPEPGSQRRGGSLDGLPQFQSAARKNVYDAGLASDALIRSTLEPKSRQAVAHDRTRTILGLPRLARISAAFRRAWGVVEMSSDHLSFNQSGDPQDDGARWEAYLALLRRTGVTSSAPEPEDEFAGGGEPLMPADLAASGGGDAENGATDGLRPTPPGAVSFRLGLVGATIGLAAGIVLTGASLIPHAPAHRDAAVASRTPLIAHGREGWTRLAAESGPPCLSGGDSSSAGSMLAEPIAFAMPGSALGAQPGLWSLNGAPAASSEALPARLASAPSPRRHHKLRHLARRAHECRHCRGDLSGSDTMAAAARWQAPWSR